MSGTRQTHEGRGQRSSKLSGLAVALGCVLFLGGFIWGVIVYEPFTVPTPSMTPTIDAGDRVLAQRIDGSQVHRGDVVVFRDASWGDLPLVKRVVGIGGDKVACCTDGKLTVNGKEISEPYLAKGSPASASGIPATKVPQGRLFVLGDERRGSLDSSMHLQDAGNGSVPRSAVDARVDAVAWPMRGMPHPSGFAGLPGGLSQPGPLTIVLTMVIVGAVLILGGAAWPGLASRMGGRSRSDGAGRGELAGVR
ncbi:signal peptidase I [Streptomyces sp. TS71-3]|uniref:signal peptidase I n=1 Tax=Streptomyces sp. TS71-3 TaxID=2733862 RepID=UPI001B18C011|nr:signal peptidase I [Streptomyces sp. TS71-3]GHJ36309.1 signal peptidase I [Streptomyces sp. TS71-3]